MDTPSLSSVFNRTVTATTPLPGVLKFRSMHGREALSELFEFEVDLIAETPSLDMQQLLGKPLTLEIKTSAAPRYLNGQIARSTLVGRQSVTSSSYIYRVVVRPWLWYATQTSDNKIFQNTAVPDVITEVLSEYNFPIEMALSGSYRTWEYCVQYQETDFAFISRLMEHEGIYYWFRHENGQHTLVLTDDMAQHKAAPGYESLPYFDPDRFTIPKEEYVSSWQTATQITSGGFATVDYDFTKPGASLDAVRRNPGEHDHNDLEMYEWQGGYTDPDHAEHYVRVRLEELQNRREQVSGQTTARGLAPGYLFSLSNHPRSRENREYLVLAVTYRISEADYASGPGEPSLFEENFVALASNLQHRAPRLTPLPRTHGPQTARVVGPAGEEIWTDKYGRVKVQFHWDRYGQRNENSSCWVRVSSPWAGGGFGGLQLPRINDEVVVDFIGGYPDRPLILGRVYNDSNMPPVELPANASQSGFVSRTVKGDRSMANMLVFEDKIGGELVKLKAQLDLLIQVNRDARIEIGRNLNSHVGQNEVHTVGGTRNTTVDQAETQTFKQTVDRTITGKETVTVGAGFEHNIKSGSSTKIETGERKLDVLAGLSTQNLNQGSVINVSGGDLKTTVTSAALFKVTGGLYDQQTTQGMKQLVNMGLQTDVTGGETRSVKGGMTETIEGTTAQTINGGGYTQTVNGGDVLIDNPGHTITLRANNIVQDMQQHDELRFLGFRVTGASKDIYGSQIQVAATRIRVGVTSVQAFGSNIQVAAVKGDWKGIDLSDAGVSAKARGVSATLTGGVAVAGALLALFL